VNSLRLTSAQTDAAAQKRAMTGVDPAQCKDCVHRFTPECRTSKMGLTIRNQKVLSAVNQAHCQLVFAGFLYEPYGRIRGSAVESRDSAMARNESAQYWERMP